MKSDGQFYLKFLVFLSIILLAVVVALLIMKHRISSGVPPLPYLTSTVTPMATSSDTLVFPYFSIDYSTVGEENEWILQSFQPKLVGFESENNSNYLITEYNDSGNRKRQVKIFVTGQTPSGKDVDKLFLFFGGKPGNGEWLTFGQLQDKLVKGKQVRIEYLTFSGSAYDRTTCQKYLNFCALASIIENQNLKGKLEERLTNGETDDLVVPANVISLQLI